VKRYAIVHSYTEEILAEKEATCPADALASYSIDEGFADPRETAAELREPTDDGGAEGDFFVLRRDGLLGMIFTNYEVHAVERVFAPEP
jgi:hypothetical protein